jgi:hypothetical protein
MPARSFCLNGLNDVRVHSDWRIKNKMIKSVRKYPKDAGVMEPLVPTWRIEITRLMMVSKDTVELP